MHAVLRRLLFVAIALLFAMSIPWYRDADPAPRIVLGLPDWVAISLACYVLAAALNALAWRLTEMDDDVERAPDAERER